MLLTIKNRKTMSWFFSPNVRFERIKLEFTSVGFSGGRKPGEPGEKPSEQQGENQQQTQPTRDGEYGNRTRVTEAGGERLTTAPTMLPIKSSLRLAIHMIPFSRTLCGGIGFL